MTNQQVPNPDNEERKPDENKKEVEKPDKKNLSNNQLPANVSRTDAGNIIQRAEASAKTVAIVKKKPWRDTSLYLNCKEILTYWIPVTWWVMVTFFREYIPGWLAHFMHLH